MLCLWILNLPDIEYNGGMTSLDNTPDNPQQDMPRQTTSEAQYSLSVEQAAALFVQGNVPRSPRTISRYCENGYLDCTKKDFETYVKYFISPASVDLRIKELQSLAPPGHVTPQPAMTSHAEPRQDVPSHDERSDEQRPESHQTIVVLEKRVKELEAENLDLKITNKGKDYFISELKAQNATLVERVTKFSRYVGILKTRLQLAPPKTYTAPTPQPAEFSEAPTSPDDNALSLN
jgi:hypothetical protein